MPCAGIDFRDSAAKPEASETSHAGLRVPARLPVLPAGTEGTGELIPEDRPVQLNSETATFHWCNGVPHRCRSESTGR